MLKVFNALNQRGDTIVEVLISIAVITSVLGGTFAIANRSQKTVQANHERDQAMLYANQQAEYIRKASSDERGDFITNVGSSSPFCMNGVLVSSIVKSTNPSYLAKCKYENLYMVSIVASQSTTTFPPSGYDTYTITVSWDSLVSNAQDKVTLTYGI